MAENTLLLGNGFSLSMFDNIPSWGELISAEDIPITNYPILYEIVLDKRKQEENDYKEMLAQKLEKIELKEAAEKLSTVSSFGEILHTKNINNILTTNYDDGIAHILQNKCGYTFSASDETENVYSIHRYREYVNQTTHHCIRIWKIHGDIKSCKTMQLGLDQYGGYLAKIKEYVKGDYSYTQKKQTVKYNSIDSRLTDGPLDTYSWIDLFFSSNVYIAGFGLPFTEIDIWWLLTKRLRMKRSTDKIDNTITFIYSQPDGEEMDKSIETALTLIGVNIKKVKRTNDFIGDVESAILA